MTGGVFSVEEQAAFALCHLPDALGSSRAIEIEIVVVWHHAHQAFSSMRITASGEVARADANRFSSHKATSPIIAPEVLLPITVGPSAVSAMNSTSPLRTM